MLPDDDVEAGMGNELERMGDARAEVFPDLECVRDREVTMGVTLTARKDDAIRLNGLIIFGDGK